MMKLTAAVVSTIGAIINRFRCLERMLRVTECVLRFCRRLFQRLKGKVDKLIGVENVMKETCPAVDELLDAESCSVKYEQTLINSESEKFEIFKVLLSLFYNKSGRF